MLREFATGKLISFKTQNIYSSNTFYDVVSEFERLGWITRIGNGGYGCVEKLNFEISIEGTLVELALRGI
jgi:hypothetical protein